MEIRKCDLPTDGLTDNNEDDDNDDNDEGDDDGENDGEYHEDQSNVLPNGSSYAQPYS